MGTANDAKFKHTITPATNNNGNIVGAYNTICAYGTYSIAGGLTGIPLPSYIQLQWTAVSGPITLYSGPQGCGFTTNAPGFATITCTVLNGQGCLAGYSETYTFEIKYPCTANFSDNGSNRQFSTEPDPDNQLYVYPNPAQTKVVLKLPEGFDFETGVVGICDQNGTSLRIIHPQNPFEEIDFEGLGNGLFFLYARDRNLFLNKKLVIHHK